MELLSVLYVLTLINVSNGLLRMYGHYIILNGIKTSLRYYLFLEIFCLGIFRFYGLLLLFVFRVYRSKAILFQKLYLRNFFLITFAARSLTILCQRVQFFFLGNFLSRISLSFTTITIFTTICLYYFVLYRSAYKTSRMS